MIRIAKYLVIAVLMASCSANKYLDPGEKYFEGYELEYAQSEYEIPKDVKSGLLSSIEPEATRRFLLSRPGTWIFYQVDSVQKDKGLKYFIKYRLGNQPSLLSEVAVQNNLEIIESRVRAAGFFRAEVESELDTSEHRAVVKYIINPNRPYFFDSLKICQDEKPLCEEIRKNHRQNPIIKEGELFAKDKLIEERSTIADTFKNQGYYYFASPLLYYQADSSSAGRKVRLRLEMHDSIPPEALRRFEIDSVIVDLATNSEHTIRVGDSLQAIIDTTQLYIKPEKLAPFILLKPGEIYSKKAENLTLEQLNKLDVFEFVSLEYSVDTTGGNNLLTAKIRTSPRPKRSLRSELVLTTTSTNFTGPGLQLQFINRNLFRGAEKLRISATGRYEQQLTGDRKGLTSYEIDLTADLLVPRVRGPLRRRINTGNVPKTKYRISYRLFRQPEYYAQSNLGASYGYEWLTDKSTFHDLRLINLDYVRLLETSQRLQQLFDDGILEPESFQDQLIFGPSYQVTFRPREKQGYASFFLGGDIEFSGNLLYGAYALSNAERNENEQYEVVEVPFSQYVRTQIDSRIYLDIGDYTKLVLRQNAGIGIPYLNSSNLPFAKQFFVGGASSLRGFQFRSVGPGTYSNPNDNEDSFFDQTGDVMLEYNVETRFDMGGYLHSALFLDVGNVWLVNQSPNRQGGQFEWSDFYREFAVSTGAGLRIDADFIVVRFDLGLPLRDPARPEGNRWLLEEIGINNTWIWDNLILNFAIGYPF